MEKWQLTITKTDNGFILEGNDLYVVIEEDESVEADLKSHSSLLYNILEYFGILGSKHDKERIRIEIQKNEDL